MIHPRGRGSSSNPANRFDRLAYSPDPGEEPDGRETLVYLDSSRSIISENESPDVALARGVNPYRGCAHGCSYCFARPFHEYLGLSSGLDFETRLFAKPNAPALLREAFTARGYEPRPLALSGATDPYQPIERRFGITRQCLEVMAEFRQPVCVITKSALVERDVDLLAELARHGAAAVAMSVTTLDADLQRRLEPRASTPRARLGAIRALSAAGVPVSVSVSPVIPGLTDHEVPAILAAAREAGAVSATWILLRLPHAVKEIFEGWLAAHEPLKKEKVLNTLRQMHGGALYDPAFGKRMRGSGPRSEQIEQLFDLHCRRNQLGRGSLTLSSSAFRVPERGQMDLFGAG